MSTRTRHALSIAARIAALTLVCIVVQGIGSRFLPASGTTSQPPPQPSAGFFAVVLTVALLQTIALAYPAIRSRWHGWLLTGTVFILYFGVVTVQSQVESWVYLGHRLPAGMVRGIFLMGLFNALAFSPLLVLILGKARSAGGDPGEPVSHLRLTWRAWAWRLGTGAVVFTALYYLFGYYVAWKNPEVRAYYGGTDPGTLLAQMHTIVRDTPWVLLLQLVRGLGWVLLALPVIRMMRGPWWEAGLALALLFAVPTAYLLFPNPLMPETVRMTHLLETAPYQFLFGWFVGWLFARTGR